MKPKVSPGKWVLTLGVFRKCKTDASFDKYVNSCINRYILCDWGEVHLVDSAVNDKVLEAQCGRITARYLSPLDGYEIYIITKFGQNTTTILLPDEL